MSFYTGRYMFSHGCNWNGDPLNVGEMTMGDYLRPAGLRTVLVGKTHHAADYEGMARLGIDPSSNLGVLVSECGFEPFERDDGLHPDPILPPKLRYNRYLQGLGYDTWNPWDENANSSVDEEGNVVSGWYWRNSVYPANIKEEHSETPYMTGRAIECIQELGEQPWCIHLSYIKPHWPYIAPAPYHNLYRSEQILPANRSEDERRNPHPVYDAFTRLRHSQTFGREEARQAVIPAYMGLVKQIDDQIGRLLAFLRDNGYLENTMIVFTSDHGDYLGDHWLGEKDLFHEESVRIPLIIYDPSPEADVTRGHVETRFVEAIDLLPTFLEVAGGEAQPHRLEGRSLLPLLHGRPVGHWRDYVISESDYSGRDVGQMLRLAAEDCLATMIRTERWKYILHERFRPQLYDLNEDPHEFHDLGADPAYEPIRRELHEQLFGWLRNRKMRTTVPLTGYSVALASEMEEAAGILIGHW
jgi:arylsulfatase A-like enzyme